MDQCRPPTPRLDGAIDVEEPLAGSAVSLAWGLQEVSDDPAVLEGGGRWAVVMNFEGPAVFARFESWQPCAAATLPGAWTGPAVESWSSSLDRDAYRAGVGEYPGGGVAWRRLPGESLSGAVRAAAGSRSCHPIGPGAAARRRQPGALRGRPDAAGGFGRDSGGGHLRLAGAVSAAGRRLCAEPADQRAPRSRPKVCWTRTGPRTSRSSTWCAMTLA